MQSLCIRIRIVYVYMATNTVKKYHAHKRADCSHASDHNQQSL